MLLFNMKNLKFGPDVVTGPDTDTGPGTIG